MRENHMVGLCLHIPDPDWDQIKDLGIQWIRQGVPYPWKDKIGGTYSESFLKQVGYIKTLQSRGIKVLIQTPTMGSSRYDREAGTTRWMHGYPEWMGYVEDDFFYEALEAGIREIVRVLGNEFEWYLVANEPDIPLFVGPVTKEQEVRFFRACMKAITEENPKAQCGINLAGLEGSYVSPYTEWVVNTLYKVEKLPFTWIGLDGYYGCWVEGGPQTWKEALDTCYALAGKPIMINEWGYGTNYEAPFEMDFQRLRHFNQDTCRNKRWEHMWDNQKNTPELQAQFIEQSLRIFAEHPACIGNYFFRYIDADTCWQCGEHDCPAETHWGIVDLERKEKPGYYALRDVSKELFG